MAYDNELDWLRNRGVQIDHKGRIIVSLPLVPDGEAYDRDALEEREPSIAELMRRDVDARHAGSRGRRRRAASKIDQSKQRATRPSGGSQTARIGRPIVGAEVRVYVQTSIALQTRQTLAKRGITLAEIFDDFARGLQNVS
jgi:hypothetical protein